MMDVASLFLQTFHVARTTSTNMHGDDTFVAPEQYACRYQPSSRLVRDKDGIQVVSEAVIYTLAEVTVHDDVFPPGADTTNPNEGRKPLRVDRHFDLESGQLAYLVVTI